MRYRRADIVEAALRVLDDYSLADLSMRRLANELGLQPGALYHHVASKQALLALMADEVLARGGRPIDPDATWPEQVRGVCTALRDSMLAWRDGAELVTTAYAFGLGATAPYDDLVAVLSRAGLTLERSVTGARTLLHVTFGYVGQEQTHLQAASAGAIDDSLTEQAVGGLAGFRAGLDLVIDGLRPAAADSDLDRAHRTDAAT